MTQSARRTFRALDIALGLTVAAGLAGVLFTAAPAVPPAHQGSVSVSRSQPRGPAPAEPRVNTLFSLDTIGIGHRPDVVVAGKATPGVESAAGETLRLSGWALDPARRVPAGGVLAVLDGRVVARAGVNGSRPDVAQALGVPEASMSGFTLSVPGSALPPGRHHLELRVLSVDKAASIAVPVTVTVVSSVNGAETVHP